LGRRNNVGRLRVVEWLTAPRQKVARPAISSAPDAAASTASDPANLTIALAPLIGTGQRN
jgi:hypothetical protein